MLTTAEKTIPAHLLTSVLNRTNETFPCQCRGIRVTPQLIQAALECLNEAPDKVLPQNSRNENRSKTPDGLDLRIKTKMDFDTRTANIVSDILAEAGIVEITSVVNEETGRNVKATKLLRKWTW